MCAPGAAYGLCNACKAPYDLKEISKFLRVWFCIQHANCLQRCRCPMTVEGYVCLVLQLRIGNTLTARLLGMTLPEAAIGNATSYGLRFSS